MKTVLIGGNPKGYPIPFHPETLSGSRLRNILSKHGGSMGESGSVAWQFEKRGYVLVDKKETDEDTLSWGDGGVEDGRRILNHEVR